ncbi:MAG: ankyrin repeat domain-containing protein [Treponema sp.]|nr:ankyrin repeat domain-containing protein [Treponema sp.]
MKKTGFLISIMLSLLFCSCSNIKNLRLSYKAIRGFKDTPVFELAKAVMNQDTKKIRRIGIQNSELLYTEDSEYHYSVLHFAIYLQKYKSAEALLDIGMSANVQSSSSGQTPLYIAAFYSEIDIKFMKLLVEHGADPDLGIKPAGKSLQAEGATPLMQLPTMHIPSQKTNMEKAEYLIETGKADINKSDIDGNTAANEALQVQDVKMAEYFIVNLKADVTKPYYSPDSVVLKGEEKSMHYPVNLLRNWWIYPLDSEEYKIKMEIVKEFERQGVDYSATPIPDWVLEKIKRQYPDTWEEYIKVY